MSDPDPIEQIHECFRRHVPEVANGTVALVKVARDVGNRTLVVVRASDVAVHPVAVCASPSKRIARELGEKLGVILYAADPAELIKNSLIPIGPSTNNPTPTITLDTDAGVAWVEVPPDSVTFLSTPGEASRVALVSKLLGWDIRIIGGMRRGRFI